MRRAQQLEFPGMELTRDQDIIRCLDTALHYNLTAGESHAKATQQETRQQGIEREPLPRPNRKDKGRKSPRPTTRRMEALACGHCTRLRKLGLGLNCSEHG